MRPDLMSWVETPKRAKIGGVNFADTEWIYGVMEWMKAYENKYSGKPLVVGVSEGPMAHDDRELHITRYHLASRIMEKGMLSRQRRRTPSSFINIQMAENGLDVYVARGFKTLGS